MCVCVCVCVPGSERGLRIEDAAAEAERRGSSKGFFSLSFFPHDEADGCMYARRWCSARERIEEKERSGEMLRRECSVSPLLTYFSIARYFLSFGPTAVSLFSLFIFKYESVCMVRLSFTAINILLKNGEKKMKKRFLKNKNTTVSF